MDDEEKFIFDLSGFVVLDQALAPSEVDRLNASLVRPASPSDLTALQGQPGNGQWAVCLPLHAPGADA